MDVKVFLCISFNFISIHSYLPSKTVFSPSELTKSDIISNSTLKEALRYGFHRISECNNFDKAFICVQKCVDLGYDIAYSDKYCFCTCYVKKEKAKHSTRLAFTKTKWKHGAPITTKPAWADKNKKLQSKVTLPVASTKNSGEDNETAKNDTVVNDEKFIKNLNDTENIKATNNLTTTKDEFESLNITSNRNATKNFTQNLDVTENVEVTNNLTISKDKVEGMNATSNSSVAENFKQNHNATENIEASNNKTISTNNVEELNATSNSSANENATAENLKRQVSNKTSVDNTNVVSNQPNEPKT